MEIEFEMKANPAPNDYAVITWRIEPGKKEPFCVANFTGERAKVFAEEYLDFLQAISSRNSNRLGEMIFNALHRRG